VLISDFLAPLDRLETDLLALAASGHELVVFQVLDPAEVNFDFDRAVMFEDLETGKTLFVDPATVRADYLKKLEVHCTGLRETCQKLGASCHRLDTSRPLELALYDFLRGRTRRRSGVRRVNQPA
jgi:uncharacterized protein (DUF58 family)